MAHIVVYNLVNLLIEQRDFNPNLYKFMWVYKLFSEAFFNQRSLEVVEHARN